MILYVVGDNLRTVDNATMWELKMLKLKVQSNVFAGKKQHINTLRIFLSAK
jgi:hypothetical protein